jgi:aquaporin Z
MESIGKAAVAEFVATLALIFIGTAAVAMSGAAGSGLVGIALAHGIVLAVMVSVIGHISGGHVNPAVTAGLWIAGKIPGARAAVYVAAQLAGAVAGALLLKSVMPADIFDSVSGGTPLLNPSMGVGHGVLLEAILTFFLVFAVFGTAVDGRGPFGKTAGFTIGLVLTFDILAGGPLTGAAMNPARAFGPALVSGTWGNWWIYWIGPVAGGVIAAALYQSVFLREGDFAD